MEELLSNDRQISSHRTRQDYKPSPVDTLLFAYGDGRYEKFAYELTFASNVLKLKILKEICEDFHRADKITLGLLSSGLLDVLLQHFEEKDEELRELATRATRQISAVKLGKDRIIAHSEAISKICATIDDSSAGIRLNAYETLLNISEFQEGSEFLLSTDLLFLLVDKLIEEKNLQILEKALLLIKNLLYGDTGTYKALPTMIIARLSELLEHQETAIRELAIQVLACLSFLEAGKVKIIAGGCVSLLCARLKDSSMQARENATLALASLAQMKQGKVEILDFFEDLQKMLAAERDEKIQLNLIELIASLAEHPEGREKAKGCLDLLKNLSSHEYLQEYIADAVAVITWKP